MCTCDSVFIEQHEYTHQYLPRHIELSVHPENSMYAVTILFVISLPVPSITKHTPHRPSLT
jgi:hypothetical protein